MAQRIQQFDPSMAAPVAQSYLNHDSVQKGIPQMNSNVPPRANMDDGSLYTNLQGGQFQAQRNMTQGYQQARANRDTLAPQAAAAVQGMGAKEMTRQATAEKKANDYAQQKIEDVLYFTAGAGALKELSTKTPEVLRSIQVSQAMFGGPQPGTLSNVRQQIG